MVDIGGSSFFPSPSPHFPLPSPLPLLLPPLPPPALDAPLPGRVRRVPLLSSPPLPTRVRLSPPLGPSGGSGGTPPENVWNATLL